MIEYVEPKSIQLIIHHNLKDVVQMNSKTIVAKFHHLNEI